MLVIFICFKVNLNKYDFASFNIYFKLLKSYLLFIIFKKYLLYNKVYKKY